MNMRTCTISLSAALALGVAAHCVQAQVQPSRPDLTTIRGSVPSQAATAKDAGVVSGSMELPRLTLYVARTQAQQIALEQMLVDQQNAGTSTYHHWLTPEEFGTRFGVSVSDESVLRGWLVSQGFANVTLSRSRTVFTFSGNAALASNAFHTSIHSVVKDGETRFTNVTELALPTNIAPLVHHIAGLNDFRMKPQHVLLPQTAVKPAFSSTGGSYGFAPGDIATQYDLQPFYNAGIDGTGITVVVLGQSEPDYSEIQIYRSAFNLPANTPQDVLVGTDDYYQPGTQEADLDLELLGAVARNAKLIYVHTDVVDTAMQYAVDL